MPVSEPYLWCIPYGKFALLVRSRVFLTLTVLVLPNSGTRPFFCSELRELDDGLIDSWPNTVCLKLLKPMTTTVTLSKDLLNKEFFMTYSTPIPHILWISLAWFLTAGWNLLSWTALQTQEIDSLFSILSKIPSHPRMIKSCSLTILNFLISGLWITHFGFPPRATILASGSPKVLATESLPGSTLSGPAKFNS